MHSGNYTFIESLNSSSPICLTYKNIFHLYPNIYISAFI